MGNQPLAGRGEVPDRFSLGDWQVCASTHELTSGDTTIRLEPRTMEVLVYLAERAGEAVTREQLEEDVWRGVVVGYDSLSHSIAKLRKAFGDDPNSPRFIETIPKVGYRLIAPVSDSSKTPDSGEDVGTSAVSDREPVVSGRLAVTGGVVAVAATIIIVLGAVALLMWTEPWKQQVEDVTTTEQTAPPVSDKPSIAVLPFVNLSDDPAQEYFSDGFTDDLITDLARVSGLFVIARNSSFAYKGGSTDVRDVARELGVRYVLEGSVRKADERIRINAQLIDASTGGHLWAERYEGLLTDVFELQDRVAGEIVTALRVQLTPEEELFTARQDTHEVAAYDAFLKGWAHMLRKTPEDAVEAVAYFKQAIELDENYHRAYAALAQIYWDFGVSAKFKTLLPVRLGERDLGEGDYMTEDFSWINLQKARGGPSSESQVLVSRMLLRQRRFEEAMQAANSAVALGPNDPVAWDALIENLVYSGQAERAISVADDSIRLDPRLPGEKLFLKGLAYYALGHLEDALSLIDRARTHNPELTRYALIQAAAMAELGRTDEARAVFEEFLSAGSTYTTLNWIMIRWPFQDLTTIERLADGLLELGIPKPLESHYMITSRDRLTGAQIKSLLANKTMIGMDRSYYGLEDEFEVRRNGGAQIIGQGFLNYFASGNTRIENDLLCDPWWEYGEYCVPVFRNPHGDPEKRDEYVFLTFNRAFTFSVFESTAQ